MDQLEPILGHQWSADNNFVTSDSEQLYEPNCQKKLLTFIEC
jgi:hypothetical protein